MFGERFSYNPDEERPAPPSFKESGGKVLEYDYDEDGRPINWVCGIDDCGELVHPAGVESAVAYLATSEEKPKTACEWRGAVPEHSAVKDWEKWRG